MRTILGVVLLSFGSGCSDPIHLKWKRKLPAPSVSTPLVTGTFVAVGHETGVSIVELNGTLRCVFPTRREVISRPATDGKRIFFGSSDYVLYAIDSGCTELWKFSTEDRIKSDPLVANGRVIIPSHDGKLYALDGKNGQLVWTFPHQPSSPPPPTTAAPERQERPKEGDAPAVLAPPPASASPPVVGGFSYSAPVLADGRVFVGNLDHHVYAVDVETGELRARFPTNGPVTSTPLVRGSMLYFGSNDGSLYAYNLKTQKQQWRLSTGDWISSSPVWADNTLYVGSNDRYLYAVDAATGQRKWRHPIKGPAVAVPAVYQNLVLAAGASGDGAVYALQRTDGTLFWRYGTNGKIEADPVVVGDRLYVSSADQYLYEFVIRRTSVE